MIQLDEHDRALVGLVKTAIEAAISSANVPVAVAKRIVSIAMKHRNRGRSAAVRRYPFGGVCEASGQPIAREHAELDEQDPELGYKGRLRWVCQKANNSGTHTCGVCK